ATEARGDRGATEREQERRAHREKGRRARDQRHRAREKRAERQGRPRDGRAVRQGRVLRCRRRRALCAHRRGDGYRAPRRRKDDRDPDQQSRALNASMMRAWYTTIFTVFLFATPVHAQEEEPEAEAA